MSVRLGVIDDERVKFEAQLGHVVQDVRLYCTTETPPSGDWSKLPTRAASGYISHMSFRSANSWASVAGGSEDARATTIGNYLAGITPAGYITFHHEPQGEGTASDFQAAFARVMGIIKGIAPAWKTCNVMTGGTFWFANAGGPDAWWVNGIDTLGVDAYNRRGTSLPTDIFATPTGTPSTFGATDIASTFITTPISGRPAPYPYALSKGATLILPEFGCACDDPSSNAAGYVAKRANWIQAVANDIHNLPFLESVTYYDRDQGDSRVNWALAGTALPVEPTSLAAFESISVPTTSTMKVLTVGDDE